MDDIEEERNVLFPMRGTNFQNPWYGFHSFLDVVEWKKAILAQGFVIEHIYIYLTMVLKLDNLKTLKFFLQSNYYHLFHFVCVCFNVARYQWELEEDCVFWWWSQFNEKFVSKPPFSDVITNLANGVSLLSFWMFLRWICVITCNTP